MQAGAEPRLELFGTATARAEGTSIYFPQKGFQLIALVLLSHRSGLSRQAAASLLWENTSDQDALRNLRQLLLRIRRSWPLPETLVESDGALLEAGPGCGRSDLADLLECLEVSRPADVMKAAEIARQPLLHDSGSVSEEFAAWLNAERQALQDRLFSALSALLLEQTRFGVADIVGLRAIEDHMLALDPAREQSYRALLEAFGRAGHFDDAKRIYSRLTQILESEYGSKPSNETSLVARRIFAAASSEKEGPPPAVEDHGHPRIAFLLPTLPSDPGGDRLVEALIQEIANDISRFRTFRVVAPHSSFQVHAGGHDIDFGRINAQYAVSSTQIPGAPLLSCRLFHVASREILWAAEIPAARDKLALAFRMISYQTASSMVAAIERSRLNEKRQQRDPHGYLRYLEGQVALKNCDLPKLRRARAVFRDAANMDPRFCAIRARIAQTFCLEWLMLGGSDPDLLRRAKAEAAQAIELDTGAVSGHWVNGVVSLYQRDFDQSEESFMLAEALAPHNADFLLQHADALTLMGDIDSGWERFEQAIALNPLPPDHYWWAGASMLLSRRDFTAAIEMCGRMENDEPVIRLLAACHALAGDLETARSYGRRVKETYPDATAASLADIPPYKRVSDREQLYEGLRLAGIN
jgi:pentatricopeptide repeat protein